MKKNLAKAKRRWRSKTKKIKTSFGKAASFLLMLLVLLFLLYLKLIDYPFSQSPYQIEQAHREEFVETLVPTAKRLQEEYNILASVSLAQASIESDFGRSQLASEYNNLYGVKTSHDDPDKVLLPTKEYVNDKWYTVDEPFKVYESWDESMQAHAELLYHGTDWNPMQYSTVLNSKTAEEQALALQNSGYATDPNYADALIALINEMDLEKYDHEQTQESSS